MKRLWYWFAAGCVCVFLLPFALLADGDENGGDGDSQEPEIRYDCVWTNAAGGLWRNAENWLDGALPATGDGGYDYTADFAQLGTDMRIFLPNSATKIESLYFGADGGPTSDVWRVARESGDSNSLLVEDELRVRNGALYFDANFNNANRFMRKTGPGVLRLYSANQTTSGITVEDGQLQISATLSLVQGTVAFNLTNTPVVSPSMKIETDSAMVGKLEVRPGEKPVIDLNGKILQVGTKGHGRYDGYVTSNGTLRAAGGGTLVLDAAQTNAVNVAVRNGSVLELDLADLPVGLWRFEDPANPGKDSAGYGNDLSSVGNAPPGIETDATRGSVIRFNGANGLVGSGSDGTIPGLPRGDDEYTVAFWFKADADVVTTASILGWGTFTTSSTALGLRLNSATQWTFSNWGNNKNFACPFADGGWHHLALCCRYGATEIYVDGAKVATGNTATLNLEPKHFQLGKANGTGDWTSRAGFKGLMDDVIVLRRALYAEEVAELAADRIPAAWLAATASVSLPVGSTITAEMNGTVRIRQDVTTGSLDSETPAAQLAICDDSALTVRPEAGGSSYFAGRLTGSGRIVKDGTGSQLALAGTPALTGTVEVAAGQLAFRDATSRHGPVAYYRFDDPDDPWKDSSAYWMNLTETDGSGATLVEGLSGSAAYLNGNSYLVSPSKSSLPILNMPHTVVLWVKFPAGTSGQAALFSYGKETATFNNKVHGIRLNSNTQLMASHFGDNQNIDVPNLRDGSWHQIVSAYDTAVWSIYTDGVLRRSVPTANLQITASSLKVGCTHWNGAKGNVMIDEFAVYAWAWDAAQVADSYEKARSLLVAGETAALPDPVAHYAFDDETNPGKDSGPYGYDLATATGKAKIVAGSPVSGGMLSLLNGFDYLQPADGLFPANLPTGNSPCTISMWVNAANADMIALWALVFWGDTAANCYLIGNSTHVPYSATIRFTNTSASDLKDQTANFRYEPAEHAWHHIVAKYNPVSATIALMIDGIEVATKSVGTMDVSAKDFYIGMKPSSLAGQVYPACLIDEVRIYDVTLSNAQGRELYLQGMPRKQAVTALSVASGAEVVVGGRETRLRGLENAGTTRLAGGTLLLEGVTNTFSGTLAGVGVFGAADGAKLTIASPLAMEDGSSLVATNAELHVAAGAAFGEAAVRVQAGGRLTADTAVNADVEFGNGARLDVADSLTVNGTVTLGASCEVDAHGQLGVFTLVTATTIPETDLTGWTIRNIPNPSVKAKVGIVDNKLVCTVASPGTFLMIR